MKINEKILNFIDILSDLEDISKKLYLESPEAWVDFSDKVSNEHLDEMVLFYATKYNYVSIIKFVQESNIINLNAPSRNKNFSSIKDHLIAVANDYKSIDVYNYLVGNLKESQPSQKPEDNSKPVENTNSTSKYSPVFICPYCSTNILESGYKVYEEVIYNFSKDANEPKEVSRKKDARVFCCSCNNNINDVSVELLEDICSIHNCKKCGKDLTSIGIDKKIKMNFDDSSSKFLPSVETFNCPSCQNELSEYQVKFFNLQ